MNKSQIALAAVLLSFPLIAITNIAKCTVLDKREAKKQAEVWARSMSLKTDSIECVGYDSDGDGYVSCSISYKTETGVEIIPIECSAAFTINDGCRSPKASIRFTGSNR